MIKTPISDNDKSLIANMVSEMVVQRGAVEDAIEKEKRLVNEQLRLGVEPGKVRFVSSGSGERPLLQEDDVWERSDAGTTWPSQFTFDGSYADQSINRKEKDTLIEEIETITSEFDKLQEEQRLLREIENQPVVDINIPSKKSKEDKLPKKLRNGW